MHSKESIILGFDLHFLAEDLVTHRSGSVTNDVVSAPPRSRWLDVEEDGQVRFINLVPSSSSTSLHDPDH